MQFQKITEEPSPYTDLDKMSIAEIISVINKEDKTVALAVEKALPQILVLIREVINKLQSGGRLFYLGAGTSGRLGILDASEMPPSFGVPPQMVQGIIAGGKDAITAAVEFAEDDTESGWFDLQQNKISDKDFVIGISASGTTPFVLHSLKYCRANGIKTGAICCNPNSPVSAMAEFGIEIITGPEVITGSTRMKAATAQKMLLNMISSTVMIVLGMTSGNKMVNLQPLNQKLIQRGINLIMNELAITDPAQARKLLEKHGSVKKAMESFRR